MSKTARAEGWRREERERPTLRVGHFAYDEAEPPTVRAPERKTLVRPRQPAAKSPPPLPRMRALHAPPALPAPPAARAGRPGFVPDDRGSGIRRRPPHRETSILTAIGVPRKRSSIAEREPSPAAFGSAPVSATLVCTTPPGPMRSTMDLEGPPRAIVFDPKVVVESVHSVELPSVDVPFAASFAALPVFHEPLPSGEQTARRRTTPPGPPSSRSSGWSTSSPLALRVPFLVALLAMLFAGFVGAKVAPVVRAASAALALH
jgi:hypothetical protein